MTVNNTDQDEGSGEVDVWHDVTTVTATTNIPTTALLQLPYYTHNNAIADDNDLDKSRVEVDVVENDDGTNISTTTITTTTITTTTHLIQ